ncbi:MAG: hypothetical protein WHS87_11370 [Anaerolineales bacterium]
MHRSRRRPPFPWGLVLGGAFLLIVLVSLNFYLLQRLQGGGEMRFLWEGLRLFWYSDADLYSQVQSQPLRSGFEQVTAFAVRRFDVPLPFLLLLSPLVLLPSGEWAAAVGLLVLEVAIPLTLFLALQMAEWPLRRIWQVGLLLLAVFWPYSFLGWKQVAPFWLFLALLHLGLLAFRSRQDELAGAIWSLLTLRWEATAGALLFLTFYVVRKRRWRVLAGAGMFLFLIYNVAFLITPGWFLPFLRAVAFNLRQGFGLDLMAGLLAFFPPLPFSPTWALRLGVYAWLILEWRLASLEERPLAFYWTLNLTLALTPFLGLRTDAPELTMLFPSLLVIAALTWKRWPRYGLWLPFLLLLVGFSVPWALWRQALTFPQEERWMQAFYLFPSAFALIGLYWLRWSLFRPRTWLDRVRSGDVI